MLSKIRALSSTAKRHPVNNITRRQRHPRRLKKRKTSISPHRSNGLRRNRSFPDLLAVDQHNAVRIPGHIQAKARHKTSEQSNRKEQTSEIPKKKRFGSAHGFDRQPLKATERNSRHEKTIEPTTSDGTGRNLP